MSVALSPKYACLPVASSSYINKSAHARSVTIAGGGRGTGYCPENKHVKCAKRGPADGNKRSLGHLRSSWVGLIYSVLINRSAICRGIMVRCPSSDCAGIPRSIVPHSCRLAPCIRIEQNEILIYCWPVTGTFSDIKPLEDIKSAVLEQTTKLNCRARYFS